LEDSDHQFKLKVQQIDSDEYFQSQNSMKISLSPDKATLMLSKKNNDLNHYYDSLEDTHSIDVTQNLSNNFANVLVENNGRVPFAEKPTRDNSISVKLRLGALNQDNSKITMKISPSKRHVAGTYSSKSPDLKGILKNPLVYPDYQSYRTTSIYEEIADPLTQTSTTSDY